MARAPGIDELWAAAPPAEHTFPPAEVAALPEPARRYLEHAIAPGTGLASAVRLRMHGEIKLGRWLPFEAEQVICWERGMVWQAGVRMFGVPIRGYDRILDGAGEMRWKLFGLIPFLTAAGPDVSRSAAGRLGAESIWLPSALCRPDVAWTASDPSHPRAAFTVQGHPIELQLTLDDSGRLRAVHLERWGNPDRQGFRALPFGGTFDEERTFGGYTVPSRLRIGWHFGTPSFETEGEFFRATVDEAVYR